jgi:hypothetical protein
MIFLLFGFAGVSAQLNAAASEKWTRFATDDDELSVAMPPGGVIDAEKRQFGQKLRIVAFQNGVETELRIYKGDDLKKLQVNGTSGTYTAPDLKVLGDFSVSRFERSTPAKFHNDFWIYKKGTLYFLKAVARKEGEKEATRFLTSVVLQGKPLFVQSGNSAPSEERVSISTLKTSPEVIEAFERKLQKNNIKVTYEAGITEIDEFEGWTRKVVILEQPTPSFNQGLARGSVGEVKLKINFLANGQIGDIVVMSISNKEFINACLAAARKIRFIPAQINGKNVDAAVIVDYAAGFSRTISFY